jgi:hypothetical protein
MFWKTGAQGLKRFRRKTAGSSSVHFLFLNVLRKRRDALCGALSFCGCQGVSTSASSEAA